MPESLVLEYQKKKKIYPDTDSEVSKLLEYIKTEVQCHESTFFVSATQSNNISEHSSNSKQNKNNYSFSSKKSIPSTAALATSRKTFYIFCKSSNHGSLICKKFFCRTKKIII